MRQHFLSELGSMRLILGPISLVPRIHKILSARCTRDQRIIVYVGLVIPMVCVGVVIRYGKLNM